MKLLRAIVSLSFFFVAAAMSIGANAATVTVNCNWQHTHTTGGAMGPYQHYVCHDNNVAVARSTVYTVYTAYGDIYTICSSAALQAGYSVTDTNACFSTVLKTIPDTPTQSCGPNAGKLYGDVFVSAYPQQTPQPFPEAQVNAFCGACGYTTQVLGSGAYAASLRVTCKS